MSNYPPGFPNQPQWPDQPGGPFPPPKSSGLSACLIAVLVLGGVVLLVCCGGLVGLMLFGGRLMASEVEAQLRDNPVLQEHIGQIESFEIDWVRSGQEEGDDTFVYRVEGTKGKGYCVVTHITDLEGNEQIVRAELRTDEGDVYVLVEPDDPLEQ